MLVSISAVLLTVWHWRVTCSRWPTRESSRGENFRDMSTAVNGDTGTLKS